jgi:muramoyltetrapeptide carboxypeptidase LdcA involved in peptidoglycan recycling
VEKARTGLRMRSILKPQREIRSPLIGFSDITILHLALWRQCKLAGFHGPQVGWDHEYYGDVAAEQLRRASSSAQPSPGQESGR